MSSIGPGADCRLLANLSAKPVVPLTTTFRIITIGKDQSGCAGLLASFFLAAYFLGQPMAEVAIRIIKEKR